MCLQFLEEAFDGTPTPRRVLDVGTGTGILGIAAALLGAPFTLGIDVDPKGVEVAGENARINGVEDRFHAATTPLSCVEGRYDLILANVLAEILSDLKQEIAALLEPGGNLILSGILSEKGDWVAKEYEAAGCRLAGRKEEGQWTALLLRREGDVA
jgi:ribosomal protein L11 methyltransferase